MLLTVVVILTRSNLGQCFCFYKLLLPIDNRVIALEKNSKTFRFDRFFLVLFQFFIKSFSTATFDFVIIFYSRNFETDHNFSPARNLQTCPPLNLKSSIWQLFQASEIPEKEVKQEMNKKTENSQRNENILKSKLLLRISDNILPEYLSDLETHKQILHLKFY